MTIEIEIDLLQEDWDWIDKQVKEYSFKDRNAYIDNLIEEARLAT